MSATWCVGLMDVMGTEDFTCPGDLLSYHDHSVKPVVQRSVVTSVFLKFGDLANVFSYKQQSVVSQSSGLQAFEVCMSQVSIRLLRKLTTYCRFRNLRATVGPISSRPRNLATPSLEHLFILASTTLTTAYTYSGVVQLPKASTQV